MSSKYFSFQMEQSRLSYEMTNQQLITVINKLSSQLTRAKNNVPSDKIKHEVTPPSPVVSKPSTTSSSSSFRRQKAIRIKKRDSVKRNNSLIQGNKAGDNQSYMSSDSGNFSDDNTNNIGNLHKLLRKGLRLNTNVNTELNKVKQETKDVVKDHEEKKFTENCKMSSKIQQSPGNRGKVIIKIDNGQNGDCDQFQDTSHVGCNKNPATTSDTQQRNKIVDGGKSGGEILTDNTGTVHVPVPYICTYYNV